MPMKPPTQEIRAQPNQPRFGMPIGEPYEPRLRRPCLGEFGNPIEGIRHEMPSKASKEIWGTI